MAQGLALHWIMAANWQAVSAGAAFFATLFALIALILNLKATRIAALGLKVQEVERLDARFASAEFLQQRARAAAALESGEGLENVDNVLDFFEDVGLLLRRGALDKDFAHSRFFHWTNIYWRGAEAYVRSSRERGRRELWTEFEKLYASLNEIERKKDPGSADLSLTPDQVSAFLRQEKVEEDG